MNKGIIYLVQPSELVGTERYKIGCSSNPNLDRCKKGYRVGTRYLYIMECTNPFLLEKNIKKEFSKQFILVSGEEYFEGNENDIKATFLKIAHNYDTNGKIEIVNPDFCNTDTQSKKPIDQEISVHIKQCKLCNYSTNDNSNYIKHLKSNKHLNKKNKIILPANTNSNIITSSQNSLNENTIMQYKCFSCGNVFTRINNLTRHHKICTKYQNEMFMLKLKLQQYEKEIKQYKKEIAKHVKENECNRQLLQKLKK